MVFRSQECPNCGAPLTLVGNQCSFCRMPLAAAADGPAAADGGAATDGRVASAAAGAASASGQVGDPSAPFAMRVDDVFTIKKRGTVATGQVAAGTLRVGDRLVIEGPGGSRAVECSGIEMFRKTLEQASAGDNVGILLRGVDKGQISAGDWVRAAS